MGYHSLVAFALLLLAALLNKVWRWWRARQDEYARVALYEGAERPSACFAFGSPERSEANERLCETPTTAKSTARVAASAHSGGCSTGARRYYREALEDVSATQALIRETLEEDDEETGIGSSARPGR